MQVAETVRSSPSSRRWTARRSPSSFMTAPSPGRRSSGVSAPRRLPIRSPTKCLATSFWNEANVAASLPACRREGSYSPPHAGSPPSTSPASRRPDMTPLLMPQPPKPVATYRCRPLPGRRPTNGTPSVVALSCAAHR